jgi:hypothetical protein
MMALAAFALSVPVVARAHWLSDAPTQSLVPDNQPSVDAVFPVSSNAALAFAFSMDSSLNVTKRWDDATGQARRRRHWRS